MYGCRSPGEEPIAINNPYMIVANFSLALMSLQCRAGVVRLGARVTTVGHPSCIEATSLGSDVAEISAAYEPPADKAGDLARDIERGGCRSSGGVSTYVQALSGAEIAERKALRAPKVAAAHESWRAAAAEGKWAEMRMISVCVCFAQDSAHAAAARSSPECAVKVLEAVGLTDGARM